MSPCSLGSSIVAFLSPRFGKAYGIMLTNGLPMGDGAFVQPAMFATLCRANHSCTPNAEYSWWARCPQCARCLSVKAVG